MAFTNLPIDIAALPAAAELELKPMPPEYRREVITQCALTVLLITLLATVPFVLRALFDEHNPWLWLIPLLVLLVGVLFSVLAVKRAATKGYALREHDMAFEVGLFWRKRVMLPINRVQHVEVSSGPLQRHFGLASLKFFTAGGASVDLNIDGLLRDEAEQLRDLILRKAAGVAQR
jgi:membrane protein YdbS with pleckstrin-like domain